MNVDRQCIERSSVQYGLTSIEYAIRRSPRRTTVSIAVDQDASVVVTAPRGVAREQLDRIVFSKGHWHHDHSREFWALLGRHMPDYESSKRALFELGPQLQW